MKNTGVKFVVVMVLLTFTVSAYAQDSSGSRPKHVYIKDTRKEEMRYKLLPLGVMEYSEVERVCRPWLSKGGLLVDEKNRASVLVYDRPEVIARIQKYLRDADGNAPNIRVSFDLSEAATGSETVFGTGRRDLRLRARNTAVESKTDTTQFVVARSGSSALIWTGDVVLEPGWLDYLREGRGEKVVAADGTVTIMRGGELSGSSGTVSAALHVRPLWLGDGVIEVEVFPEIRCQESDGRRSYYKVTELSSRIRVREGERVSLGGMLGKQTVNYTNIFGGAFMKRADIRKISAIWLSAGRDSGNHQVLPGSR